MRDRADRWDYLLAGALCRPQLALASDGKIPWPERLIRLVSTAYREELAHEETLAPEPIAHEGGEGCDERGGQQTHQTGDTDGEGPPDVIREDAERNEVRPLGHDRGSPPELDPAELRVAQRAADARQRRDNPVHAPIERLSRASSKRSRTLETLLLRSTRSGSARIMWFTH